MTYEWEFNTTGRAVVASTRKCHRGPMIPLEIVMSQAFRTYPEYNQIRKQMLNHVVDTTLVAVKTRDIILRVLHSNLNSVFVDLRNQQTDLEVVICERRNSVIIDKEMRVLDTQYSDGLDALKKMGVDVTYLDIVRSALNSNNVVYRVSARCAIVVLASIYELRSRT